jgi:hypothetical protein
MDRAIHGWTEEFMVGSDLVYFDLQKHGAVFCFKAKHTRPIFSYVTRCPADNFIGVLTIIISVL